MEGNTLNTLIKRRNQLNVIAKRQRKLLRFYNPVESPSNSSGTINPGYITQRSYSSAEPEITAFSTSENVQETKNSSKNSDIIEASSDTENESFKQNYTRKLTIYSSDSDKELSSSEISITRPLEYLRPIENDLIIPTVRTSQSSEWNSTQKIKIISNIVIKPPNLTQNFSNISDTPQIKHEKSHSPVNFIDAEMNTFDTNKAPLSASSEILFPHNDSTDVTNLQPNLFAITTGIEIEKPESPSILEDSEIIVAQPIASSSSTTANLENLKTPKDVKDFSTEAVHLVTCMDAHNSNTINSVECVLPAENTIKRDDIYRPLHDATTKINDDPDKLDEIVTSKTGVIGVPVEEKNVSAANNGTQATAKNLKINTFEVKKSVHHSTSNFKRSCMDFMLEDDFQDFSSGSSDLWSPKDSDCESSIDEEKKKKKKKIFKRQIIAKEASLPIKKHKRENKIRKRKELKTKGLSYETSSGKTKAARKIKDNPCKEKCANKCFEITEERRTSLFNYFWGLDDTKKKDWIVQCASTRAIKRKKTDSIESRRNRTYEYFINEGEGRKRVCQQFILHTLDISQTYLLYNLQNSVEGISGDDHRRRSAVNKYDEAIKKNATDYIENLPVLPSHYSRKKSSKLYLPQEFKNCTNLYRLYVKYCANKSQQYLSERLFTDLFRKEYNIAFHIPKKDKCQFCTRHENKEEKTEQDLENYKQHILEKKASYKRCEIHRNMVSNTSLVASFDLQKVLNTPHGESMLLYYSRKYAVYNLTVYESGTQNGFCYTWGECDGKRGSVEIGTCLNKYLSEVDNREVKYLILYCDSCGGQNKNKVVLSVLRNFLSNSKNLEVIQINFLLPGHTYMPVDSMHSVIEREVRRLIVWSPRQWPTFMQTARKTPHPYQVTVLDHTDFIDWHIRANEIFTKNVLNNKNLKLKDLRVATFKKKNLNVLEVKYTMLESEVIEIPLGQSMQLDPKRSKGKGIGKGKSKRYEEGFSPSGCLPKLYNNKHPISSQKYKDLKKLCDEGTIPKMYHQDYLTLPYDTKVTDTITICEESDNSQDTKQEEIAKKKKQIGKGRGKGK